MALNFTEKKAVVKQVNDMASSAISIGVAEYLGLTVEQMTKLRLDALDKGVNLQVVKNTLARRALKDTNCECVTPVLKGPVILGFSDDAPGAVARVFSDFIKENDALKVKGLGVSGDFVEANELKRIAKLPTKDEAISILMAVMLAPTEKLARTLNEIPTKVTRAVSAVGATKQ